MSEESQHQTQHSIIGMLAGVFVLFFAAGFVLGSIEVDVGFGLFVGLGGTILTILASFEYKFEILGAVLDG